MRVLVFAVLASLGAAAPHARQIGSTCELDPSFTAGLTTPNYYVANWASSAATDGQQCSVVDSFDATSISWHSTFSWTSSELIRGNPNAGYSRFKKADIAQHKSILVSWEWKCAPPLYLTLPCLNSSPIKPPVSENLNLFNSCLL